MQDASGRNTQPGSSVDVKMMDGLEAVGTSDNLELATSPHLPSLGRALSQSHFPLLLLLLLQSILLLFLIHPQLSSSCTSIMPCISHRY